MLHVFSSELLVIDDLHIPVGARLPGRFVGQHHDAGVTGFLNTGSSTLASLGTIVMASTLRAIRSSIIFTCCGASVLDGPYTGGVEVKLFPGTDYPFTHPVKPWHAVHF